MLRLEDLKVKPGDAVQPFVERLLHELPDLLRPYSTSSLVRFVSTPQGTAVIVDAPEVAYVPPLKVSVSQLSVTVKRGFLNDVHVPTIKGVPLDGISKDGKVLPVPKVDLRKAKPNDELKSWVCLQVRVDAEGRPVEEREDWCTIVHTATLTPPEELLGWQPLAMLTWGANKASVLRVDQITMHNLKHAYVKAVPVKGQPGRHYFWAV